MKKTILCSVFFLMQIISAQSQFRPDSLAGLKVWLSADTGVVFSAGKNVQQWSDRSGNNNNAIQLNVSEQPILIDSVCELNNHPVIRFDFDDDFLEIADNSTIDFTDSMTVLIVTKQLAFDPANETILSKWDWGADGSWMISTTSNNYIAMVMSDYVTDISGNYIQTNYPNLSATMFWMMSIVYNGNDIAVNRVKIFINGTPFSTVIGGTLPSVLQNSSATLKIGRLGSSPPLYYNGDIAEIIIYDATLNNAQRQQVEAYLQLKYTNTSCTTSIEEASNEHAFKFYPNPITSSSFLQFNTCLKDADVIIYDMLGKEIMRKKMNGSSMEIERGNLESGVYFVKVSGEERQWVEKIIVE